MTYHRKQKKKSTDHLVVARENDAVEAAVDCAYVRGAKLGELVHARHAGDVVSLRRQNT